MSFEEHIREWAGLDTRITQLNGDLKDLRRERGEAEQHIIRHVQDNSLSAATVRLSDSRLRFVDSRTTPPLTYKFLRECLGDIMTDDGEVDAVIDYIRNKRKPKVALAIKRVFEN